MGNLYISPTGNDSTGDGSIGNPFLSVEEALKPAHGMSAGDTLFVRGGTYPADGNNLKTIDPNGASAHVVGSSDSARITIAAYQSEVPVWTFKLHLEYGADYITIDGITWDATAITPKKRGGALRLGNSGDTNLTNPCVGAKIQNCTFKNFYGSTVETIRIDRATNVEILNNTFDNNRCRVVNTDAKDIYFTVYADTVTISGNTFTDCGGDCIILEDTFSGDTAKGFTDVVISNNTAEITEPYQYRDPFGTSYATSPSYTQYSGDTYTFSGNTITRASGTDDLTAFEDGSSITITGSVSNNTTYTVSGTTSSSVTTLEAVTTESTPVAATLTSFNAAYCGENFLDVKYPASGLTVYGNTISHYRKTTTNQDATGGDGNAMVFSNTANEATIYRNTIIDCPRGLTIAALTSPPVAFTGAFYSNILYDISSPPNDSDQPITAGPIQPIKVQDVTGFDVYNNTVDYSNNTAIDILITDADVNSTVIIANNVFNAGASSVTAGAGTPTMDTNCWGANVTPIPAHQDAGDVSAAPGYRADFKPKSGGNLVGAGTVVSGSGTDFSGKSFKNPPSIGAYEYYLKGFPQGGRPPLVPK